MNQYNVVTEEFNTRKQILWPENTLQQIKLEAPSMLWAKLLKLSYNFIINSIHIAETRPTCSQEEGGIDECRTHSGREVRTRCSKQGALTLSLLSC
jgi:hypothetical protein